MEKLWTTAEVAQCLGITEEQVGQLIKEGKLTGYKLGGKFVRFRPEQVQALKHMAAPQAARAQAATSPARTWPIRLRDFVYFYDFYILSFTLLAGVFIYLVWSG